MGYLRPGDALVVWKLDRLGRSLQELLKIVSGLNDKGVGFISLTEGFDTTTANGKLIFSIFGALSEFERAIIRERVNAGLDAARARGVKCGRKKKLQDDKLEYMKYLYREKKKNVKEICRELGISRATFYRALDTVKFGWKNGFGCQCRPFLCKSLIVYWYHHSSLSICHDRPHARQGLKTEDNQQDVFHLRQ